MPEETAASSSATSMDEKPCSSNAATAEGLEDVLEEAKKLIGTGNRHMVMGDVVSAVSVFQDACGMLAEKYGDTADECGEAFFLCGKALLELARMENTVLGNALEGVPEESSEEGEKQEDSKIESADNLDEKTRDELREQVYDAMAEKENVNGYADKAKETPDKAAEEMSKGNEKEGTEKLEEMVVEEKAQVPEEKVEEKAQVPEEKVDGKAQVTEKVEEKAQVPEEKMEVAVEDKAQVPEEKAEVVVAQAPEKAVEEASGEKSEKLENVPAKGTEGTQEANVEEKMEAKRVTEKKGEASPKKSPLENAVGEEVKTASEEPAKVEEDAKSEENGHGEEKEDEEMEDGDDDDDDDDEEEGEGNAEDKDSEDEVGNLQLAWEMLEVAKVIYKRKESKEDQLVMAQIFLKLGEVGAESGNYGQALDDFQECLALQLKHLPPHSRLLAETHYQLGMTFSFTNEFRQAIEHFSSSIKVIETRVGMLQEVIDKAEGEEAVKEQCNELEELKQLLPEIKEKVEDAKESQKTAAAASVAIQQTMGGASTSSVFPAENGGASSSSTVNQIPVKREAAEGAASSKSASDISHLVRKKRKPEEESPKQDSEAKKVKQEATVNGSGDSASNGNGVQEKMEQEASA
ncbi:hypothetical protein ACEWY4_014364 [Coilia grayii]|uniref:Tetratricopeptide SHNi-TPR domain-containing protein n=1 Tax=Coilia grayii TaxID=363190 RepID=A0ABD1JS25_9TELE